MGSTLSTQSPEKKQYDQLFTTITFCTSREKTHTSTGYYYGAIVFAVINGININLWFIMVKGDS